MTQTTQRNDFTSRLIAKHIRPGMHVLDTGCGSGEISFLLADVVGDRGSVHGVDVSSVAIVAAEKERLELGRRNVTFSVGDISHLEGGSYDAIFGRRVLMYLPDPLSTVTSLQKLLKPGGLMVFQESDESGSLLNGPDFPVHNQAQAWVWETVKAEGGDTHIGSKLYGLMKAAGLQVVDYGAELVLQTAESGSDLAWVVSVMQERMKAAGIPVETDGLAQRLEAERQHATRAFVRDLAYGICAERPQV